MTPLCAITLLATFAQAEETSSTHCNQGRPEGGGQKGQIAPGHKKLNSKGGHIWKKNIISVLKILFA